MIQKEFCQDCHQKHNCQEVYRQLSHATCPSITRKVIGAFLLPMVIFIVSLAFFYKIFAATAQQLHTIVSFLMALLITSLCLFVTRVITRRFHKEL